MSPFAAAVDEALLHLLYRLHHRPATVTVPVDAQDIAGARQAGGPGAELEAGEMGVGRKSGPPAGNVLVTPNNAAAANHNEPISGANAASGNSSEGSLGSGSSGEPDRKN